MFIDDVPTENRGPANTGAVATAGNLIPLTSPNDFGFKRSPERTYSGLQPNCKPL
jgi:hypothetical protein